MKDERAEIILETIKKFPNTPTTTLAKKIYKEHPKLWSNLENVRAMIRYRRGNKGKKNRLSAKEKFSDTFRENGKSGFKFMELPKSVAKPIKPFKLPSGKLLVLSDIHIPYHDNDALRIALDYGESQGIEHIVLNGDICDFFAVGRWQKNPEERNLSQELMLTRQFLQHLRERFPKARIIYKIGNHEERWESYMYTKAPEICGVSDFEIYNLLNFAKYGVEECGGRRKLKAGKHLTLIHGHELFGGTAPVNFARTLQTNLGVCAIAGHRHQSSQHSFKTADDKHIMCWSIGCLCDMQPEYAVINKWNHGFMIIELEGNHFVVNNKRIINGIVV